MSLILACVGKYRVVTLVGMLIAPVSNPCTFVNRNKHKTFVYWNVPSS